MSYFISSAHLALGTGIHFYISFYIIILYGNFCYKLIIVLLSLQHEKKNYMHFIQVSVILIYYNLIELITEMYILNLIRNLTKICNLSLQRNYLHK